MPSGWRSDLLHRGTAELDSLDIGGGRFLYGYDDHAYGYDLVNKGVKAARKAPVEYLHVVSQRKLPGFIPGNTIFVKEYDRSFPHHPHLVRVFDGEFVSGVLVFGRTSCFLECIDPLSPSLLEKMVVQMDFVRPEKAFLPVGNDYEKAIAHAEGFRYFGIDYVRYRAA